MRDVNRRQFLRQLAAGLGVLAGTGLLGACRRERGGAPTASPSPARATPVPTATVGETVEPTAVPATGYPDLAVARGGEPEELVRQALAALGGMERFVRPGDNVIIKPNICVAYHSYEYAATTNPWVVGALVKLCFEAGARLVRVMDNPFGGGPEAAYARTGIGEQVEAAGGRMETMSGFKFIPTEIPDGLDLSQCDIYDEALYADVLIDVPIAKHHSLARLTLGMKNLMGLIYDRPAMHVNLGQRLADLASRLCPALTVVDAVRILVANGPTGGSLDDVRQTDTVIASPDIVAADSYAATLFGLEPNDLSYVRAATAMGLGRSDLDGLNVAEVTLGT